MLYRSIKLSKSRWQAVMSLSVDSGSSVAPNNRNLPEQLNIRLYGQPTAETHCHLLQKGEITPGITMEEYGDRRHRLANALVQYADHMTRQTRLHVAIVPSATKVFMSENIPYPFRQNSDFLYLTGFAEPDSLLLLKTSSSLSSKEEVESVMFVPKRDRHSELWDGARTGRDGAVQLLGVSSAYDIDELPDYLNALFGRGDARTMALWCDMPAVAQPFVERTLRAVTASSPPKFITSPKPLIQQLRLLKSPAEAVLMRRSCDVTAAAFVRTIAATAPGTTEHQLNAQIEYECRMRGADRLAYPIVVAGGNRANAIHYVANSQVLAQGEMVLVDAGCEYHGYVSDVTRTWPVICNFEAAHRELYQALLDVQLALINLCRERPSLDQLFTQMQTLLGKRLQEVGVIGRSVSLAERTKLTQKLCPHHVSHYLGMDVHDTFLIPRSRPLQPGMVFTVEPGVYIREDENNIPREFRGVGLRIEDNIMMTEDGLTILSDAIPKTVADIEAIRRENNFATTL